MPDVSNGTIEVRLIFDKEVVVAGNSGRSDQSTFYLTIKVLAGHLPIDRRAIDRAVAIEP